MKKLCAVSLASLLVSALALADTVDNPGDFNLSFSDGVLKIANLPEVPEISQLTIAGSVDGDGNVTIPAEGIVLPDLIVPSPIGDVTVRVIPLADASGTLIPLTGEATATVSIRFRLIHPLLPETCGIGPVDATLTTGDDGDFTGVPYSMDDGTATYVNGTFEVPVTDGCGAFYGPLIDGLVGLPSPSGNNYVNRLQGTFDTIFTGS